MTKGIKESASRRSYRVKKLAEKRLTRKSVVKMLRVMAEQSPDATRNMTEDFLTTGRAGRRNALPDILGEHALVSTSDLPDKLQKLTTRDEGETSSSSQQQSEQESKPSTSSSCASTSKSQKPS